MLVRKWIPYGNDFAGDPIMQVVVPEMYRSLVLRISHDKTCRPSRCVKKNL